MIKEVDGNEFFLDQYLQEQDKHEEVSEVSDKDEFSGEELHDLLCDTDFEQGLNELVKLSKEYPQAGFDAGVGIAKKYIGLKKRVDKYHYIEQLARDLHQRAGYWFDAKWLVVDSLEEKAIDSVVEVLTELIYKEKTLSVEDFLETYTVGFELLERITDLGVDEQETAYKIARQKRLEVAHDGLIGAGITKDFVLKNTPSVVSGTLLRNTKEVGKRSKRLLVSDEDAKLVIDTLGLLDGHNFVENNYANVYEILVRTPQGGAYKKVVERFNHELRERIKTNGDFSIKSVTKLGGRLTVYKTDNYWVVLGSRLVVFRSYEGSYRRLMDKPVSEVRVKDIKDVTSAMH